MNSYSSLDSDGLAMVGGSKEEVKSEDQAKRKCFLVVPALASSGAETSWHAIIPTNSEVAAGPRRHHSIFLLIKHSLSSTSSSSILHFPIMAATAKYQAAPTRDSFEEQPTQAPPSYQDNPAAGSSSDGVLNYGTPRSEDDNVPDDFKVRSLSLFHTFTVHIS
jgi:hypothetical protein